MTTRPSAPTPSRRIHRNPRSVHGEFRHDPALRSAAGRTCSSVAVRASLAVLLFSTTRTAAQQVFALPTPPGTARSGGEDGSVIDPLEPEAANHFGSAGFPELTHKGSWLAWFLGIIICGVTVVSILFADDCSAFVSPSDQNVEDAEPTEWEMTTRYLSVDSFCHRCLRHFHHRAAIGRSLKRVLRKIRQKYLDATAS